MSARSSRLATDLEAAAAAARDPIEADCLRADLAAQWARLGRIEDAERMMFQLREKYRDTAHPRLTPWMNFAESLIDVRSNRSFQAVIKMRRAHALSVASNLEVLAALAGATLAHFLWNAQNLDAAVALVRETLQRAPTDDHRSRCAASLLVGEMLALSRERAASDEWFARARNHAMSARDDASLSALNFNLSAVELACYKQSVLQVELTDLSASSTALRSATSQALDQLLAIPIDDMSALQHAQVLSIGGKCEEALACYEEYLGASHSGAKRLRRAEWLADEAWCHARLKQFERAIATAEQALLALTDDTQTDDRASVHSRLSLVYDSTGSIEQAELQRKTASLLWKKYNRFQSRCAAVCLTLTEQG